MIRALLMAPAQDVDVWPAKSCCVLQVCSHVQAKPHMLKSEVVDNETGKSQPSECVSLCLQLG